MSFTSALNGVKCWHSLVFCHKLVTDWDESQALQFWAVERMFFCQGSRRWKAMIREARESLPVLGESLLLGESGLMCQPGLTPIGTINPGLKWQGVNALQGDYYKHCALILPLFHGASWQSAQLVSGRFSNVFLFFRQGLESWVEVKLVVACCLLLQGIMGKRLGIRKRWQMKM